MAWLATNTKAVCGPINRVCGRVVGWSESRGLLLVYPMKNYVHGLVTTSFRVIIPLSLPGRKVIISRSTTFSSVQFIKTCYGMAEVW